MKPDTTRKYYSFRCKYCKCESVNVIEIIQRSYKLMTAALDPNQPENGVAVQCEDNPDPEEGGKYNHTKLVCSQCGAVWSSASLAITKESMYLHSVTSDQYGLTFTEHVIPEDLQNGLDVYDKGCWGDAVKCESCGWMGFVLPKRSTCPHCRTAKSLVFQHALVHRALCFHACYNVSRNSPDRIEE